jgi:hypothetical protein
MLIEERIRREPCGCRTDVVTGLTTDFCQTRHSTEYDVWWCAPCDAEWTVRSRPHNPKCPTCKSPGWWRRFIDGPAYEVPEAASAAAPPGAV